jgi:hypothetical protein
MSDADVASTHAARARIAPVYSLDDPEKMCIQVWVGI